MESTGGETAVTIRALVFDFDGLILDTETPMRLSWREIFHANGLTVSDEQWASLLGSSADPAEAYDLLEAHLGSPINREALRAHRTKRELRLLETEGVLPGVLELITEARSGGLKLAVASSSERSWVKGLLAKHGLLNRFDAIVCAEDVARTKPSPDLYTEALRRIGTLPSEAIALEDSEHGAAAARAAGMYVVAVPNRVTACLAFENVDARVETLESLRLAQLIEIATPPKRD